MRPFQTLKVWQKAHQLTLHVYCATRFFPKDEQYGLSSQLRRAAASIPANIAEGCGRASARDLVRFTAIAAGSASELQYHLLLAHELDLLETATYQSLQADVSELMRMLNGFANYLTAHSERLTPNS